MLLRAPALARASWLQEVPMRPSPKPPALVRLILCLATLLGCTVALRSAGAAGAAAAGPTFHDRGRFGGSGDDEAIRLDTGPDGSVYILSVSDDLAAFRPALNRTYGTPGQYDLVVTRYGPDHQALWCTGLAGTSFERAGGIAVYDGKVYVGVTTFSKDFPTTEGTFQGPPENPGIHVALCSLDAADGTLSASTYFRGDFLEACSDLAVNDRGVYIVGDLGSGNLPFPDGAQSEKPGSPHNVVPFAAVFTHDLSQVPHGTFWGASSGFNQHGVGIALDGPTGDAFICGNQDGDDMPVVQAAQPTRGGLIDGFCAGFDADLEECRWSTYCGGPNYDFANDCTVGDGFVACVGTAQEGFPVKMPLQPYAGGNDTFVSIYTLTGAQRCATCFGGSGGELGLAVAAHADRLFMVGATDSRDLHTRGAPGAQPTHGGGEVDGFCCEMRLGAGGVLSSLEYCSYYGGGANDHLFDCTYHEEEPCWECCGDTSSPGFGSEARVPLDEPKKPDGTKVCVKDGPACPPPHQPKNFNAIKEGKEELLVFLTWDGPGIKPKPEGYLIERRVEGSGKGFERINTIGSNEKDKEYKYRITPPKKGEKAFSYRVTPYVNCQGKQVWGKATRGIEIKPADSGGILIRHFDIQPEQVKGGKEAEGKADLNKPATEKEKVKVEAEKKGGKSPGPLAQRTVTVPRTVTIRKGERSLSFPIKTRRVRKAEVWEIRITLGDDLPVVAELTVLPRK
jgi:hypothetical protein